MFLTYPGEGFYGFVLKLLQCDNTARVFIFMKYKIHKTDTSWKYFRKYYVIVRNFCGEIPEEYDWYTMWNITTYLKYITCERGLQREKCYFYSTWYHHFRKILLINFRNFEKLRNFRKFGKTSRNFLRGNSGKFSPGFSCIFIKYNKGYSPNFVF